MDRSSTHNELVVTDTESAFVAIEHAVVDLASAIANSRGT
jgi:hypothetical protein